MQQQYADDTQLYIAMSKSSSVGATLQLKNCVTTLHRWFAENRLALNPDKSEAVLFSSVQRAKGLLATSTVEVAGSKIDLTNKISFSVLHSMKT